MGLGLMGCKLHGFLCLLGCVLPHAALAIVCSLLKSRIFLGGIQFLSVDEAMRL